MRVSENSGYKTVKWIENILIKAPDFALSGRKVLVKSNIKYKTLLIDIRESPIKRPKKDDNIIIQVIIKGIL